MGRCRMMKRMVWMVGILAGSSVALAQAPADQQPSAEPTSPIEAISSRWRQVGPWENYADITEEAVDNLWATNQWSAEADQFAARIAKEVGSIPPWEIDARLDTMSGAVAERYGLDDAQRAQLETALLVESFGLILKHAPTILKHAKSMSELSYSGDLFDPANVAEFAQESRPIIEDSRRRALRIAETLRKSMDESKRALLDEDLRSFERRMDYFDRMGEKWARGEWKPEDWGMTEELIKEFYELRREAPPPPEADRRPEVPPLTLPDGRTPYSDHDETTWERYVRLFIETYRLDASQADAANSILAELQLRAADYRQLHGDELAKVPPTRQGTAPAFEPLKSMFEELKARLAVIPTSAQLRSAER